MQGFAFGIIRVFMVDHISLQGLWEAELHVHLLSSFSDPFYWMRVTKFPSVVGYGRQGGGQHHLISACKAGPRDSKLPESHWEQLLSPRVSLVEVAWAHRLLTSSIMAVSGRILASILLLKPFFSLTLCILVLVSLWVWNSLSRCCCEY